MDFPNDEFFDGGFSILVISEGLAFAQNGFRHPP